MITALQYKKFLGTQTKIIAGFFVSTKFKKKTKVILCHPMLPLFLSHSVALIGKVEMTVWNKGMRQETSYPTLVPCITYELKVQVLVYKTDNLRGPFKKFTNQKDAESDSIGLLEFVASGNS